MFPGVLQGSEVRVEAQKVGSPIASILKRGRGNPSLTRFPTFWCLL